VAIYANPKVLLLDEPTSQFDPEAERTFTQRMQAWLKTHEVTLVLVTHRQELLELVDNMLVLVQGRAMFGGSKTSVMAQLKQAESKGGTHGKRAA
jgi:ABC-type bacteriocin/lantibiotic exporter with double-glycine peptidase domain